MEVKKIKGCLYSGLEVRDQDRVVKLITANSTTRKDGALVMGRGNALAAAKKYPWVPYLAGHLIRNHVDAYNVLFLPKNLGLFQVKYHWRDEARLDLITLSAQLLSRVAATNEGIVYCLPFPGIGNGRLSKEDVLPILEEVFEDNNNIVVIEK